MTHVCGKPVAVDNWFAVRTPFFDVIVETPKLTGFEAFLNTDRRT